MFVEVFQSTYLYNMYYSELNKVIPDRNKMIIYTYVVNHSEYR